jgi:hypothetical protein
MTYARIAQYQLYIEILAHAIRKHCRIQGIKLDGIVYKVLQYADDTYLFIEDEISLKTALMIFQMFSKCSGLNINMHKSELIWISNSSNYQHKPLKLKWTQGATCLGVYISNDLQDISERNIASKTQRIKDIQKLWTLRKLTQLGKVRIINTQIVPQLLYLYIPKQLIDKYNRIITNFIWDNKRLKVKYKTMINSTENGGQCLQACKMVNVK